MTDQQPNKCMFCSGTFGPDELTPHPNPAVHWNAKPVGNTCAKCDAGTRANDRALRAHYIKLGLIKPGVANVEV